MTGVPFLAAQLGPSARISVEIAWGANLSAAYSSWTWTDITTDAVIRDGITFRHGRNDEASDAQPAACELVLNNSTGAYSLGGQSPNWPNVRANTPLRVMVDPADGSGFRPLFIGYADSWIPSWNQAATMAEVHLTASGILRRLGQRSSPVLSALRRRLTTETNVRAYWPLEEGRKTTQPQSGLPGHPPMEVFTGDVDFGGDTDSFDSSVQTAILKNGALAGAVPLYTHTGSWQARALMAFPDSGTGMTDQAPLLRVLTDSISVGRIDMLYTVGGGLEFRAYNSGGTLIYASGPIAFAVNGTAARVFMELSQVGANVTWKIGTQDVNRKSGLSGSGTMLAVNLGRPYRVFVSPNANHDGLSVGHVVVQDTVTSIFTDYDQLSAYDGEAPSVRFNRLCTENGIARSALGDGTSTNTFTDKMGVQKPKELLSLLRDLEAADDAILWDGDENEGLTLYMRRAQENRTPSMTVTTAQLAGPLSPVDDDANRLNKAQATREDGASATYEDVTGPLGTAAVGTYDDSTTVNVQSDAAVSHFASWLVHKGTVEGYRYPSIELDFAATPTLIPSWLGIWPGRRIDVTGPELVAAGHPAGTLALQVQGYSQTLTPHTWRASVNCAPFEPWRVIRLAADTGDSSEFTGRLDTDGSTLAASAAAGATSLSVATASGPLWTRTADDFPLTIEVGGIAVTVTAISGAASPQTFTVTGSSVTKALVAGLAVKVYRPTVLGL